MWLINTGVRRKAVHYMVVLIYLLAMAAFLLGCVSPQDIPAVVVGEPLNDDHPSEQTIAPKKTKEPEMAPPESISSSTAVLGGDIDVFLPGTLSMLGFIDVSINESVYIKILDTFDTQLHSLFPETESKYFRYDLDLPRDVCELPRNKYRSLAAQQSFYFYDDVNNDPYDDKPMAIPINGYYKSQSLMDNPIVEQAISEGIKEQPLRVAIKNANPDALSIFVTDFHELLQDRGDKISLDLRDKYLANGLAVGMLMIKSDFSGLIPGVGDKGITYRWPESPSGSATEIRTTDEDGKLVIQNVAVDPSKRETRPRPFYIIVCGPLDDVTRVLSEFADRAEIICAGSRYPRIREVKPETLLFATSYIDPDFIKVTTPVFNEINLKGNMPNGLVQYQLQKTPEKRYYEVSFLYPVSGKGYFNKENMPSDIFSLRLGIDKYENNEYSEYSVILDGESREDIGFELTEDRESSLDDVILTATIDIKSLPKANYRFSTTLLMSPIQMTQAYNADTWNNTVLGHTFRLWETNKASYRFDKTIYLSFFIDSMSQFTMNLSEAVKLANYDCFIESN